MMAGNYDHLIRALCQKSASLKSDVTIRWGHEMDLASAPYAWSAWTPFEYVVAYRHFVDTCRTTGGGLHFLHELRSAGYRGPVRSCETVTLTYITRMEGPGLVNIYSYTKRLRFAALPGKETAALFALIKPLYPEIQPASSVLETGLSNLNAVFHPEGMIMNAGWIQHTKGDFLFYREGFTDAVGRVTAAVDAERMAVAKALGIPTVPFIEVFYQAGLTTKAAHDGGDIARACQESEPNKTIKSPSSLDHRYMHEDVGYGLVPMAALGRLAGVATPTIDALIQLAGLAVGIDYAREGLTLERLGVAGKSPSELLAPGTTRWSHSRRTMSPILRDSWCRATRAIASVAPSPCSPATHSPLRSWSTSRRTWPGSARASPISAPTTSSPRIPRTCSPTR